MCGRCGFAGIDYRVAQQKRIAYNFVGIQNEKYEMPDVEITAFEIGIR